MSERSADSSSTDFSSTRPWPVRPWLPLDIPVGPCAWRVSMLASDAGLAYVDAHPSLLVVEPEDDPSLLARVKQLAQPMPVLIRMDEPAFMRRFESQVRDRIAQLGLPGVAGVVVNVQDTADLKTGGLLHTLFTLREQGVIGQVGLAAEDVLAAEWICLHSAVRILMFPFSIEDQAAQYRLLPRMAELGLVGVSSTPSENDQAESLAFALGMASQALCLRDRPLPDTWQAMDVASLDSSWQAYQAAHEPPPALPRSRPPE